MTAAEQYARDVVSGKIVAGNLMIKACERFVSDLKRKDIYFDHADAERYCNFMKDCLCLWEDQWRGDPLELLPYQSFITQNIFGWKKPSGKRRFTDAYIQTAKKQAKTTLMAAIAWAHTIIDKSTPTPQVIIGANNEDQAKICVNCIGKMVDVSPALFDMLQSGQIQRLQHGSGYYRITYKDPNRDATIEGISRDPKTKAGKNPSLVIIDEYAFAESEELLKELSNAQGLRAEPLTLVITTPGFDKTVPCYSKLRKSAVDVLNGVTEMDSRFVAIFEPDNEEDWENPDEWIKANPIIEYVPTVLEKLKIDFSTAKAEGGHSIVDFKTKNLGLWCDAATVWIEDEVVKKNSFKITDEDLAGQPCYVAWDLSKGKDLSSCGFLFPNVKGKIVFKCLYWIPEDKITSGEDQVDYRLWVDKGWITTHPGNVLNHNKIASDILSNMSQYDVKGISFDAKYAYTGVAVTVAEDHAYEDIINPIGQGFNLSAAVGEVENAANEFQFDFMGNPVTRWCFSNVEMNVGEQGHRYPSKKRSRNKIDGVSCLCTAWTHYKILEAEPQQEAGIGSWA